MEPHLLVLDYPGYRAEARVDDLRLGSYGFRQLHLLAEPLPHDVIGSDYAERLLAKVAPLDGSVAAVLGYCASAPIAHELAAMVMRARLEPPSLIVFDAEPVVTETIVNAYRSSLAQFGVSVSDEELAEVIDMAALADRPWDFLDTADRDLARRIIGVLRADGCEEAEVGDLANQLVRASMDWLTHLVAAFHSGAPEWGGDVLHIAAGDRLTGDEWPGARRTRTVRIDCERRSLLCAEETRSAVLAFLAENPKTSTAHA